MEKFRAFVERVNPREPPHEQLCEDEATYIDSVGKNRTVTDVAFLAIHGVAVLVLFILLGYCIANGDINRLVHGTDNCGNACGFKNDFLISNKRYCEAQDMTRKPYLSMRNEQCVERCDPRDGEIAVGYQCYYTNTDIRTNAEDIFKDIHKCVGEIIGLSFLALGFAIAILVLLRYFVHAFVWVVLGISMVAFTALSAFLINAVTIDMSLLPAAASSTFFTVILALIILVLRRKIMLVIQLLKEAAKSVIAMPLLLFQPLLTFAAVLALSIAWIYCTLWIVSAGIPTEINGKVIFEQNSAMRVAFWYNLFMIIWIIQFTYGCQNMVTAGAVAKWYFTRNKSLLKSPILSSFIVTFKYHLGTISAGSLTITIIRILRYLFRRLRGYFQLATVCCPVTICLAYIEGFINYLTRNAYVVVSIHGFAFYQAGARTFKLITDNITGVIALNSLGDFVLGMAKLLVVFYTVLIGYFILQGKPHVENIWLPLTIVGIIAFLVTHCFISIYEMAIDTIFICFCEDSELNDGITRPYFMSKELMEFVENAKKVFKIGPTTPVNAG